MDDETPKFDGFEAAPDVGHYYRGRDALFTNARPHADHATAYTWHNFPDPETAIEFLDAAHELARRFGAIQPDEEE